MAFRRVARADDIPTGGGLCVEIDGIDVGLFRVQGDIHAMENRCPHAGDPLSEGVVDGPIVTCRAHGWKFDIRTGFRPEDGDGFPIPRFATRIVDGAVEVDITQTLNIPPRRRRAPGS